jgi:hypothetical protein
MTFQNSYSFLVRVQAVRRIPREDAFAALQGIDEEGNRLTLLVRPGERLFGKLVKIPDEFGSKQPELSGSVEVSGNEIDALLVSRESIRRDAFVVNLSTDPRTGKIQEFGVRRPNC